MEVEQEDLSKFLTVKAIPQQKAPKKKHFDGMGKLLDKSYDSMGSNEKDAIHYEFESDNEPPTDEVGDMITVIKKG